MSKRHRSDDDGGELESRRPHSRHRRRRRRRHLYVVLDDWSKGYSVYKVDVDGFDGDPDADLDDEAVRLPEPPVFRLETADYGRFGIFVAVGSRIFATHYSEDTNARAPVLMFDTVTGGLAVCPGVPAELCNQPMIFPAGDKVYAMGRSKIKMDARGESRKYLEELAADGEGSWAWSSSVDDRAPPPPFDVRRARCHAAHPDAAPSSSPPTAMAPTRSTPGRAGGRATASGCCRSTGRPTTTASWTRGWGSGAATRAAAGASAPATWWIPRRRRRRRAATAGVEARREEPPGVARQVEVLERGAGAHGRRRVLRGGVEVAEGRERGGAPRAVPAVRDHVPAPVRQGRVAGGHGSPRARLHRAQEIGRVRMVRVWDLIVYLNIERARCLT